MQGLGEFAEGTVAGAAHWVRAVYEGVPVAEVEIEFDTGSRLLSVRVYWDLVGLQERCQEPDPVLLEHEVNVLQEPQDFQPGHPLPRVLHSHRLQEVEAERFAELLVPHGLEEWQAVFRHLREQCVDCAS